MLNRPGGNFTGVTIPERLLATVDEAIE